MLAFKFFVFISIVVNLFNSFKKVKEENSTMARTDEEDTVVVQIRYTSSQGGVVMNVRKAQRLRNMLLLIGVFMMLGFFSTNL